MAVVNRLELATTQRRDSSSWDKDDLASAANLKTRHGIILMPQPSDDPNDPLNWFVYTGRRDFALELKSIAQVLTS